MPNHPTFANDVVRHLKANWGDVLQNVQKSREQHKVQMSERVQNWLEDQATNRADKGPRADQLKAYQWFDSNKGWTEKWPLQRASMRGETDKIVALVNNK